ncbi:MAG: 3-deoxy-D-manno-octulosonate 8-phosphate phosphatase (KDO 8-P phosphatase) [Candidatus Endobugula sp.]|jgi:3-deoxy-D-manno-octulosonate 8-phosphate phosphatase (KDO 8-P phosphatase)
MTNSTLSPSPIAHPSISSDVMARAKNIRLLVLDVDGVLSDGKLFFSNSGEEMKAFNSLDGHGIKMLKQSGVDVAIITGRKSNIVEQRANSLGIDYLLQGREDKLNALNELLIQRPTEYSQVAHMGDDYPDLPLIRRVGLGLTTANAHYAVKHYSHWRSKNNGGEGAVREACDMIMLAQDSFSSALKHYL